MGILKLLEYVQYSKNDEKTVLISTDRRITLQKLQNQKKHTHIIEQTRTKIIEMEELGCLVEFSRTKTHAGHPRNELPDQLETQAVSSETIEECYTRIPKCAAWNELNNKV